MPLAGRGDTGVGCRPRQKATQKERPSHSATRHQWHSHVLSALVGAWETLRGVRPGSYTLGTLGHESQSHSWRRPETLSHREMLLATLWGGSCSLGGPMLASLGMLLWCPEQESTAQPQGGQAHPCLH